MGRQGITRQAWASDLRIRARHGGPMGFGGRSDSALPLPLAPCQGLVKASRVELMALTRASRKDFEIEPLDLALAGGEAVAGVDAHAVQKALGERLPRSWLSVGLEPEREKLLARQQTKPMLLNGEFQHLLGEGRAFPLAQWLLLEGVDEQHALCL